MATKLNLLLFAVSALFTPGFVTALVFDSGSLSETVEEILHQLTQLQIANSEIRLENSAMKEKIECINNVNRQLKEENSALRKDVKQMKEQMDELTFFDGRIPRKSGKSRNYSDQLDVSAERKRLLLPPVENNNQSGVVAAFSAQLHGDLNLGQKQDVVYGNVVTNLGNWYDKRHGHFTAPARGIYLFSASIFTDPAQHVHVSMVRNGVVVAILYSDSNGWDLSSQTIVLVLEKGDMVWIRHFSNGDILGAATLKSEYNTFSGVLLHILR